MTAVAGAVKAVCQHGVNINTGTRYNDYDEYVTARYSEYTHTDINWD